MTNNKIINLGDPTDDKDAVNKQCLEQLKDKKKKQLKPSHKKKSV